MSLERILHPTDLDQEGEAAFAVALKLALDGPGLLMVVHVHAQHGEPDWSQLPRVRSTLARWGAVADGQEGLPAGMGVQKWWIPAGNPTAALEARVREVTPDLIVMSTRARKGIERLLAPSVAEPLARRTRTPTLFLPRSVAPLVDPETGRATLQRVLFPVEDPAGPPPRPALELAAAVARCLGVERPHGDLLHVGRDVPEVPSGLPGWSWDARAVEGDPVERIVETARGTGAGLIVMTTRGHDGLMDVLLGSTVERVLRESPCAVLTLPATRP